MWLSPWRQEWFLFSLYSAPRTDQRGYLLIPGPAWGANEFIVLLTGGEVLLVENKKVTQGSLCQSLKSLSLTWWQLMKLHPGSSLCSLQPTSPNILPHSPGIIQCFYKLGVGVCDRSFSGLLEHWLVSWPFWVFLLQAWKYFNVEKTATQKLDTIYPTSQSNLYFHRSVSVRRWWQEWGGNGAIFRKNLYRKQKDRVLYSAIT